MPWPVRPRRTERWCLLGLPGRAEREEKKRGRDLEDAGAEYRRAVGRSAGALYMMRDVENPMVVDAYWNDWVSKPEPKGFYNRRSEVFVSEEDALEHAVEAIQTDEFERDTFLECFAELVNDNPAVKEKFLEWFYKNWERTGD